MLLRTLRWSSSRLSVTSSSLFSSVSTVDHSGSSTPSFSTASHKGDHYDVLISGGGVVGASLAASLLEHTSGLKIGLHMLIFLDSY